MANPNPYQARMARAEKRKRTLHGSIPELRERVWKAVKAAEGLLSHDDPSVRLRAVHAITQAAASYVRVAEAVELDARVERLESHDYSAMLAEFNRSLGLPAPKAVRPLAVDQGAHRA
jgi:hypothetical protein